MTIESATYVGDLNTANPASTDPKSEGDDHLRLLKTVLKNSFPNDLLMAAQIQGFRLTLTSGSPVTTADVTAATTIYATPYKSKLIALYDGTSKWNLRASAEMSIAIPAAASQVYDVFCYDNAGTPALELAAWTNDTTRATALVYQDGVLVKSGATTRRYLGTFRTTVVAGQSEDSVTKRYVWNYTNRVARSMRVRFGTGGWVYNSATWRQAGGAAANQLDFVVGVSEDSVEAEYAQIVSYSVDTAQNGVAIAFGMDSTTTPDAHSVGGYTLLTGSGAGTPSAFPLVCVFRAPIVAGRHTLVALEQSVASGTHNFGFGLADPGPQPGISGMILG